MRRWQRARQGLQSVVLVVWILVSCSAPGSDNPQEGCGGLELTDEIRLTIAAQACLLLLHRETDYYPQLSAILVYPSTYLDICIDPVTGLVTATETSFGDHNAQVTLSNTRFPTASGGFDIRILGYSVFYSINQCPALARGCPPLPGFTVSSQTTVIPVGTSVTLTLPFVPLRVKQEYVAAGGELFSRSLPSYDATYVFTAQTISFNQTFTVSGDAEFTIGDFLTSGFTCQGILE